jgi:hypothetical protein
VCGLFIVFKRSQNSDILLYVFIISTYVVTFSISLCFQDCLCGLVVRVLGYRSGDQGSIPGSTKKKLVGLKRGPLSLVSTTEELLDGKIAAPV